VLWDINGKGFSGKKGAFPKKVVIFALQQAATGFRSSAAF
jgi:hypothetical protein